MTEIIIRLLEEAGLHVTHHLHPALLRLIIATVQIALCAGIYAAFTPFIKQSAILLQAEPINVIKHGVLIYIASVVLIIMLALTIMLLPIALIFVFIIFIVSLLGQTALALLIGHALERRLYRRKRQAPPIMDLLAGAVIVALISNIPYINIITTGLFLPVVTIGITVTAAVNGIVTKKFYYTPFRRREKQHGDHTEKKNAIREIINKR
ncbi:MAG: hypothetical protein FWC95_01415 [Defluviitaleaceae bacterium]|nr:hypothetical protein [Defluviitaleaceae bacterium]